MTSPAADQEAARGTAAFESVPETPRPDAALAVRAAAGVLALAACGVLLVFNATAVSERQAADLSRHWRYWDDMALAAGRFLDGRGLWPGEPRRTVPLADAGGELREIVELQAAERRIEPWQFWRVVPARQFRIWKSRGEPAPLEDPGRAALLGWAFRIFGGIAPYVLLWLGLLCALPILAWCWLEFHAARLSIAGTAFYALLAVSPYCVESLTLAHSAFGFYLLACVLLAAFSAYAVGGRDRSKAGFAARILVGGVVFWASAAARSGTLLLAPGFLLASTGRHDASWARPRRLGGGDWRTRSRPFWSSCRLTCCCGRLRRTTSG